MEIDVAKVILFIGVMAFIVSCITELLKKWNWFDKKVPTVLTVVVLSLVLCPVSMYGLAAYFKIVLEWYEIFASFMAAFIVALVSMDGWDKITELKNRFIKS